MLPRPHKSSTSATIEQKTKIVRITLTATVVSFVVFLITLTSTQWILVTYPTNFYSKRHNMTLIRSRYGIIWECFSGKMTNVSRLSKSFKYQSASFSTTLMLCFFFFYLFLKQQNVIIIKLIFKTMQLHLNKHLLV